MQNPDKELIVLESIYKNEARIRQRNLAEIAGLSLGMTNAIIKRLVEKGWLTIRKLNNRNMFYAVTPDGLDAITRKSYRYLKRTIKHIVHYKELIGELIAQVKSAGYQSVVLIGSSDLGFIVEHSCAQHKLGFLADKQGDARELVGCEAFYLLFSEEYTLESGDQPVSPKSYEKYKTAYNWTYLQSLITSRQENG
jgi:DNA-binding MarR family transcriptional regulator